MNGCGSGLKHSAFTILNEGRIQNSPYLARHIPRGELIDLLGKALLYLEVESHWRPDAVTNNCKSGFSLLEPHVCSSESIASKPPVVSLPPASVAPHSSSTKSQLQAPSSSRQPLPQSSSQAPRVSTGPPESASTASKTLPTANTHDLDANTPATAPPAPSESGGKRKSSPVPVAGPQEKRQKTEPPSREMPCMCLPSFVPLLEG
jgi:transducin (beta)-like 1